MAVLVLVVAGGLPILAQADLARLNLSYIFEKLFGFGHGQGYPKERVVPEQRNKIILDGVRAQTLRPLTECLDRIDRDLLLGAIAGENFQKLFFDRAKDPEIRAYIEKLLASK